jgi:ubiquinone/menaquinone biosynthesis C-methylase UbiE
LSNQTPTNNSKGQNYEALAGAFDQVAPHYDAQYGPQSNLVMSWMRQESVALLKGTFPPESQLLEIGCGTGEEAMHLAQAGHKVLATDISQKMAGQTSIKARAAGLRDRITCLTIPAGYLGALKPDKAFDGAFASFGSLNCEPALDRLVAVLADLLRPGAAFVCSVMARWCPMEIAWYLGHGQPRQAFRRVHRGWQLASLPGVNGEPVNLRVRYFSISEMKRVFSPAFVMERARAFPLLLPPPYLDSAYRKHRTTFDLLEPWELRLRDRWPWRGFGDHFVMVFRRR